MRKNLLALLISLALINKNAYATLARHDIDWSEYEDFALNIGRYEAGRKGIIVYKKDGTISGTIDVPMPTFYGVSDSGNGTLYADPQIIATVAHVGDWVGNNQAQRFMRSDVELSKDFKTKSSWNKLLEYSESYSPNEHKIPMQGLDHKLIRLNQVMFDFAPLEVIPYDEKDSLGKVGDLLARVGNGSPKIAIAPGEEIWSRGALTGGLNKLKWEDKNKPGLAIEFNPKTPIDTGTKAGDSGSPVFIWSEKSKKWYFFATNAAGSGSGYGKNSHLTKDLDGLYRILQEYNKIIDKTGDTDLSIDKDNEKKNLVYTKKDVNVKISSEVNLGPARLVFRDNATIEGNGKLTTAGIEVYANKTLTFKSNIGKDTIIRKVGEGDLKLEGNQNNSKQGSIHLGDGTLEIAEGSSIGKIKIGSGRATIKVTKDNQFTGNQIYFGVQGGTLDLNGHNLEFNDIFHVDKGTRIVNQPLSKTITSNNNTDSNSTTSTSETANTVSTTPTTTSTSSTPTTASESSTSATTIATNTSNIATTNNTPTFTFKPDGDRVFLGSFNGNLNVNYDANHQWELRGNSAIKDLNVKQGTVKFIGDNVLHTKYLTPSETEYHTVTFNAENIKVDNNAKLILGRASKTKANINVDGSLEVIATGKVDTSIPKAYTEEPKDYQQDTNKIVVEGKVALNNSNKVLINLENNNTAEIKSNISATNTISLHKKGDGELILSGTNSFDNGGNFDIENGIVRITDKNSAKNLNYTVQNGSTLEIQGIETNELTDLLNKFDTKFNGILSLDKNITTLDKKLNDFNQLYLGTKGNITLGEKNKNLLEHLSFLNLGGDGGTITVQGLENTGNNNSKKTLNIGNGTYRGKVVIDELTANSHLDLNVHTGVDLEITKNANTNKFIDLGYGSTAKVDLLNNLKTNSKGIVLIDSDDNLSKLTKTEYDQLQDIYIGTSKNKTLNINAEKISGNTYRFSGEGNTNLKFNLSNKDLIVDAQGLNGGVISLDKDNTNYKGKITIQGHKDQNLGSITLKASTNNSLGDRNEVVIKNGGVLDVNGKSINIKLSTESNQSGTIFSTEKGSVTLTNTGNTEIKNKISGKLDITYNGSGELSLSNTQNHFTGNINLNNGTLKYSTEGVTNQNNKININNNAKIDITKNVNSEIVANVNNNTDASILFTGLNTNTNISTKKLTLTSNVTSKGNNNGSNFNRNREINYQNLNLNNHTLITENQFLSINSVSSKGNLILKNSTLKLHGGDQTLLSTKNFDNIELNNSTLDLRDYSFKNSEKSQKIVVKGNSTISTGTHGSDGGGASTFFNSPLEVSTGSTLNITQSNTRWYVNMQIDSDVSGDGNIVVSQAGTGNLKITNNFKNFMGSLKISGTGRVHSLLYEINAENKEDRTINYRLISDQRTNYRPNAKLRNNSAKDLILKNVKDYSGEIVAESGNIILDGENATITKAALHETGNNKVLFNVDQGMQAKAGGFYYSRWSSSNDGLHKTGKGELIFIDSYTAEKSPKLYIDEGTVTIATQSDFKTKENVLNNSSAEAALTFHTNKDANLNFKVDGEYTVKNNILGEGNVSFNQANDNTKYTTDYSKLGHKGDLTINAKVDLNLDSNNSNSNGNSITLRHHLKGNNQGHLTIKGDNKTLSVDKNLNDYTGALEISDKTKLDLNLNDATLNNTLYGSGTITNQNSSNVNLNNTAHFVGTLYAKTGDISINNQFNTNNTGTIQLKSENNHYINITTTDNNSATKFNFIEGNLRKKGTGTLIINDNVTVTNINHLDLAEGNLQLDHDIKAQNIALGTNTKLTLNNTSDNIDHNITGTGNVELMKTNTLTNDKLQHTGNLIVNADSTLLINTKDTLSYNLTGNHKLTINSNNEKSDTVLKLNNDNIQHFTGGLAINNTTELNNITNLDNQLSGNGTIINTNSSNLNLNNTANFTGTLNAKAGDISINNLFAENNNGKIQLKSENNHYINITTTDNNSATKFNFIEGNLRKKGTGTLIINDNVSVGNIKHLDLDEGNLQLNHDINVEELKLGSDTKLILNSNNIDRNITGTGNVELMKTNTLTNDKLQHTGNLIVNADSTLLINTKDTLSYNLTGNHKLTINSNNEKSDTVLKLNNDNIQHFTGGLAINNTTELNNITNLDNQLSGNGIIINTNSSNLNLNNTANFTGTLNAKAGDISINNLFAGNNNGKIQLKSENGHYINFATTDNNSSAKFDFIGGNFRKRGKRSLIVDNNVTLNNVDNFVLSEGDAQLDRGINAQNIDLSKNTKLILNNTSGNINSNITGAGDVELMKPNTLTNNKLNHTGDLIVNADTNLTISGNEALSYHLKGKNTVTFSGENSTVQLHGSHINAFSGTLAINNTAELYDVGNSLTNVEGSGTIVSKSGEFSFNNTQFTGEIVADNANIKVIDAGAKKYTAKNADITLPYHLAKDNPSASFSAINGAFVKADEKQWVLNRENLDKLGKLKIQSGEVIISDLLPTEKEKDKEKNKENRLDNNLDIATPAEFIADNTPRPHPRSPRRGRSLLSATTPAAITVSDDTILPANEKEVEIKQGAKLILDTNHQVDKIKNEGTVNLNTHTLSIDDYSSEHGKIIIALNDKTNQVLNIKKTDKNVNVELVADKNTLTYLASNGIKIANLPTQLNILNEEQLTKGNYDLTNVNGMIKLLLAPNLMSKILRLTEIHQLNQLHTNEPFIDGVTVKANYSNEKIKEKFLKDYRNTLFKSQANTSGITINLGKTYGRFTGKLTLKALNTAFQSEVNHKTQQDKLKTLAAETGIKVEYKPGYGATLSTGILQSSFKQGKYALLNGNLSLYANPRYPLGKGVLTLENELSVRYTPILSQALPADEKAKLTNPFAYAYRLGLNYQYQKFDFNLATKVTFDNTQLTYIRKEAQVNSELIKGLSYQLSAGVKYHFTTKLNLSLTSDTTFSKNSTQFGAKIGVTYNF
ncbi:hypothetical protein CEP49_05490 [Mergibacter septicus]|uniref:S6 family peptidase n=1 Tax=Mergibacter septicus TaxID=221402 RepID=UPI001178E705|nr:hypothetical protein [Mergibacter septicus]AWX14041.1 hypothetical protein CEP49_05490 [Mergibacter septicus]